MKRILIAIVASALMASAANATFTVTADVDSTSYNVGDLVTIDVTLTTAGNHDMGAFAFFEYTAAWDPSILEVANKGSEPPDGKSSQTVFPQLSGSTEPVCFNSGDSCITLSQVNAGFSTVTVNGVVTAQLILKVLGGAGTLLSDHLTIGIESTDAGHQDATSITIGPNYQVATIVPEPTTAALIGLGLVGLAAAGRRRS